MPKFSQKGSVKRCHNQTIPTSHTNFAGRTPTPSLGSTKASSCPSGLHVATFTSTEIQKAESWKTASVCISLWTTSVWNSNSLKKQRSNWNLKASELDLLLQISRSLSGFVPPFAPLLHYPMPGHKNRKTGPQRIAMAKLPGASFEGSI